MRLRINVHRGFTKMKKYNSTLAEVYCPVCEGKHAPVMVGVMTMLPCPKMEGDDWLMINLDGIKEYVRK